MESDSIGWKNLSPESIRMATRKPASHSGLKYMVLSSSHQGGWVELFKFRMTSYAGWSIALAYTEM
eukprot:scaffold7755_cov104-Cylindrotheca_fusiformis.AAC.3